MDKAGKVSMLKSIPKVEEVLKHPTMLSLVGKLPHDTITDSVREEIGELRQSILDGSQPVFNLDSVALGSHERAMKLLRPSLRHIINATGVVLHTNMGRSILAPQAIEAVNDVMRGYSNLEYDIEKMKRGSRHDHCERLLCTLTGAESAIAVNNNAAAVILILSEFAAGHEAIVSRGELVELGGSFRIPDIMEKSNARMIAVGTTNKTHPQDYERALTENTSMMLKVHKSNFQIIGFTQSVSVSEMKEIAKRREKKTGQRVLVYEDQGSGSFVHLERYGANAEPTAAESLAAGADLVSFSGDKMLGGPQAGIIVGSKELIDRLKENPLARVLRMDKLTLAALEATLRLYLQGDKAVDSIPTVRMLSESAETVRERAGMLKELIDSRIPEGSATTAIIPETSRAGGGSLPMYDIDTYAVEISNIEGGVEACEKHLAHNCPIPIVARINRDALLCDPRTLLSEDEMKAVAEGFGSFFDSLLKN